MTFPNIANIASPRLRWLLQKDPANASAHMARGYDEAYRGSYDRFYAEAKADGKSERDCLEAAQYKAEGAEQERDRYFAIEAVAKTAGPGFETLTRQMKADGRYTAGDLAQAIVQMSQPESMHAFNVDRLKVQREANATWAADPALRMAFDENQKAYVAFRVVAAQKEGSGK